MTKMTPLMLLLAGLLLLMGQQHIADAAGRVSPMTTGSSRYLQQSAAVTSCESFTQNSADVTEAMLKFGLSVAGTMPFVGPVASFFSAILELGNDLNSKPSMYTCMTDYVKKALNVEIAVEQRADFLKDVSSYRGSLETLHDALKESTSNIEPKNAWIKSDGKALDAINDLVNHVNIKDHSTFLILFITFITDEYLPFRSFSYSQADALGIDAKEVLDRTYNDVLHEFVGMDGKNNSLVNIAEQMVKAAYDDIMNPTRFVSGNGDYWKWIGRYWVYTSYVADTTVGFKITKESKKHSSHRMDAMRAFLVNHAETAAKINLHHTATFAYQWWPSMIPTNNITQVTYAVAVEKTHCFSYALGDCIGKYEPPEQYNPSRGNLTQLHFRSHDFIDYVDATYTSTSGKNYNQAYGNQRGGSPTTLTDLVSNPIVKIEWAAMRQSSDGKKSTTGVDTPDYLTYMKGLKITQMGAQVTKIGHMTGDEFVTYKDDFSAWKGRVYLCGLSIHGVKDKRVDGMGAHWCYQKLNITTSL